MIQQVNISAFNVHPKLKNIKNEKRKNKSKKKIEISKPINSSEPKK